MNRSKAGGAGPVSGAAARPATRPAFPAQIPGLTPQPATRSAAGAQVAKFGSAGKYGTAAAPAPQGGGLDSDAVRLALVRRLVAQGLQHPAVERAMATVPRHRFVDSALASQAYEDISLPIGLGQTISQPTIVARMLELLCTGRPLPLGRVLEVGTGCGYQAALLSLLCHEVYSIERLRGLHEKARENLRHFRLPNVHLLFGDGMAGFAQGAPYAGIIAAAGGEAVPVQWTDQLAEGGRIVAPMVMANGRQALVLLEKGAGRLTQTILEGVHFVPLKSGIA